MTVASAAAAAPPSATAASAFTTSGRMHGAVDRVDLASRAYWVRQTGSRANLARRAYRMRQAGSRGKVLGLCQLMASRGHWRGVARSQQESGDEEKDDESTRIHGEGDVRSAGRGVLARLRLFIFFRGAPGRSHLYYSGRAGR